VADRGYVMVTGTLTVEGTPAQLLNNDEVRAAYLGGGKQAAAV
jgi:branched-chain amino acid transport system ATP-binding protein